ncbi:hypothetical protein BDV40DRAFT_269807, partial [Aspergillus tamarii]
MKLILVAAITLVAVTTAKDITCALPCIQNGIKQAAPDCSSNDFKCACHHSQAIFNAIKPCLTSSCGPISDDEFQKAISQYCS